MDTSIRITERERNLIETLRTERQTAKRTCPLGKEDSQLLKKILVAAGGNWCQKKRAYIFAKGALETLEELAVGKELNLARWNRQAFYTPESPEGTAETAASALGEVQGKSVLEPSAGRGALAAAASGRGAVVTCVEIDPDDAEWLKARWPTLQADFLSLSPADLGLFDGVLMNPPFSENRDAAHIRHAWDFLKPGGRLVAIAPAKWVRRSPRSRSEAEFKDFLGGAAFEHQKLPPESFATAGTLVDTVLLILTKPAR